MHDCLQFAHLKLVNGSSLWTSSQMFTYCCTVSEVWFTVIIQATLWLRKTQDFVFSKSGDAQIKKAEFLTVGKAFKAIFWPAPIFGDFTVWVRYITLQGKGGGGREYHKHTGIYRYINESSYIYTPVQMSKLVDTDKYGQHTFCLYTPVTVKTYTDITCN